MSYYVEYRDRVTTVPQNLKAHVQRNYEIYSYLGGDGIYLCYIDDTMYELSAGDVVIFRPGVFHATCKNRQARYTRLFTSFSRSVAEAMASVDPEVYRFLKAGAALVRPEGDDAAEYARLTDEIIKSGERKGICQFIRTLEQVKILSRAPVRKCSEPLPETSLSLRVITYINQNYATISGVAEIADAFSYSKNHLSAMFHREMNMGLHEFLINRRLSVAAAKLATGAAITDCAMECGFTSVSYFINVFKKAYGITPGEYRAANSVEN